MPATIPAGTAGATPAFLLFGELVVPLAEAVQELLDRLKHAHIEQVQPEIEGIVGAAAWLVVVLANG